MDFSTIIPFLHNFFSFSLILKRNYGIFFPFPPKYSLFPIHFHHVGTLLVNSSKNYLEELFKGIKKVWIVLVTESKRNNTLNNIHTWLS